MEEDEKINKESIIKENEEDKLNDNIVIKDILNSEDLRRKFLRKYNRR